MRYEQQSLLNAYSKPTLDPPAYLLGSDEIGRSQIVRLLYGGQVSLGVGFASAFVTMTLGPVPLMLVVAIALLLWTGVTLFVRGQTFALREREFVKAAQAIGATPTRLMLKHILPNVFPLIFTLTAIQIGGVLLTESALRFLRLRGGAPTAT